MSSEAYAKPIPAITAELLPFFEGARRSQLLMQRCTACGLHRFPPRELCAACLSREREWVPVSGRGEVFSFTIMHQVYHPGFADSVPYAVVLVKLAEGSKFTSNLIGVAPAEIRIGMPVRVTFEEITPDVTLPKFVPA